MSSLWAWRRKIDFSKSLRPSCVCHPLWKTVCATLYLFILFYWNIFSFGPYFTEPVIAGLEGNGNTPFICSMDLIGCINFAKDFVVAGTASANLYGICESLFEPDLVNNIQLLISGSFIFIFIGTRIIIWNRFTMSHECGRPWCVEWLGRWSDHNVNCFCFTFI